MSTFSENGVRSELKIKIMWQLPLKIRVLAQKTRTYILFFSIIALCICLGGFKQEQILAKTPPSQSVQVATNWQYASFPVENFQAYTSPFGYRIHPVTGSRQFHYGLDIAAPIGSYVRNWWTGQVVELSDHTACGTSVTVQSGQWQHIYCHLMGHVENSPQGSYLLDRQGGIILQLGQQVQSGQRIARVGMTGRTTGPHLHWGLKYAGEHIDPADVLRQMYGAKV